MKIIIIVLLVILLIYVDYKNSAEKFSTTIGYKSADLYKSNAYGQNYDMSLSSEPTNMISNAAPYQKKTEMCLAEQEKDNSIKKSCCLVSTEFVEKKGELYDATWVYTFKPLKNDECDDKLYELSSKRQLFIEGENNWDNKMCNSETTLSPEGLKLTWLRSKQGTNIGSCRASSNECIDLLNEEQCKDVGMWWSPLPCALIPPYEYKDRLLPENKLPPMPNYGDPKQGGVIQFFP